MIRDHLVEGCSSRKGIQTDSLYRRLPGENTGRGGVFPRSLEDFLRWLSVLLVIVSFFLLGGCRKPEREQPKPGETSREQRLLIGLIPEQNIFKQMERYTPLARYLSDKTAVKVELKVLTRYGNIIDNFVSEGLDGAFFGSFTYALAHTKLGIEVLARPEKLDGTSTYYGLIFVRKDSGIRKVEDMQGKVFVFVDKATTAGYLFPLKYLREHGIGDFTKHFRETYFAGTHEDAIYDVLNRMADAGAAKNTVFYALAKEDPRIGDELAILERSPDVPENAIAVRSNLDASLKQRIKEALLKMDGDPAGRAVLADFGARRFIETKDSDYGPVYAYARAGRLDLTSYNYRNE